MIRSGTIDTRSSAEVERDLVALVVASRYSTWRLGLCQGLQQAGFRVMVAEDADRALCRFEKHRGSIQLVVVGRDEESTYETTLADRIGNISPATRVIKM